MKYQFDCHVHTVASGHAYSTIKESAKAAKKRGLKLIAVTDHGPAMPGAAHIFAVSNLRVLPPKLFGVEILQGVESNIMDFNGSLDVDDKRLEPLDIVLAGYHDACLKPGSSEENTRGMIAAMENPVVDVIVHPGNPVFPIDKEAVVKKSKETGTFLEINNSSFWTSRKGSLKHCVTIAELCKKYDVPVIIGSDSHFYNSVGDFSRAEKILKDIGMPEELIINRSVSELKKIWQQKEKKIQPEMNVSEITAKTILRKQNRTDTWFCSDME